MEAARKARSTAINELTNAIRQAEKYLKSTTPSIRIVQQRMSRVQEREEEFRHAHYTYCDKANIDVNDENENTVLIEEGDKALDCVDKCMIFLDDKESDQLAAEESDQDAIANAKEEDEREAELRKAKARMSETIIDEKVAEELSHNINSIGDKENISSSDVALAKAYGEKLADALEALLLSWKLQIATAESDEMRDQLTSAIGEKRTLYEKAQSRAVSLVENQNSLYHNYVESQRVTNNTSSPNLSRASVSENQAGLFVKPERTKLPTFSGDIRNFARFKKDFNEIVLPFYTDETQQLYVIRHNCLEGAAKTLVENAKSMSDLWSRLDDRFGCKIDLVDVVVNDLKNLPTMKANDDQKLVQMVDTLEKGLLELEAIDSRQHIANAYTITIVESKISRQLFLAWVRYDEKESDSTNSSADPTTARFEKMFNFLKEERRRRMKLLKRSSRVDQPPPPPPPPPRVQPPNRGGNAHGAQGAGDGERRAKCLVHPNVTNHFTRKCNVFKRKSAEERATIVKDANGCHLCLSTFHVGQPCPWQERWGPCRKPGCGKFHSELLHEADSQGLLMCLIVDQPPVVHQPEETTPQPDVTASSLAINSKDGIQFGNNILLLVQTISTDSGEITAFFDNGSTISLVSKSYTRRHNLKGIPVCYDLTTVGGKQAKQYTFCYHVNLRDSEGASHIIQAFEIDDICGKMKGCDVSAVAALFGNLSPENVTRQSTYIELLVGMRHAAIHPTRIEAVGELVLYSSIFGSTRVLGGTHPLLKEFDYVAKTAAVIACARVENVCVVSAKHLDGEIDFISSEDFGVKLLPRCDRCVSCKHCTYQIHQMSREDQRELNMIEDNLSFDPEKKQWTASYPCKFDPALLQNNVSQARSLLEGLEKRLAKDPEIREKYKEQFEAMVSRGDFRELTPEEMSSYKGPVRYVSHHEVYKEGSASTPIRIVVNSSLKFKGKSVNDMWVKGPNPLPNLYGVQLRFRSYRYALMTDISKMYTKIKTTVKERHLRRVLWRDADPSKPMRTYGTETMMFGDRPAGTIATVALHKTAKFYEDINADASAKIIRDSFMDDIDTGTDDVESREKLKRGIEEILDMGGFPVKGFVMSGEEPDKEVNLLGSGEIGRLLGMPYDVKEDNFRIVVRVNLSTKTRRGRSAEDLTYEQIPSIITMKLTKRIFLSFIQSCYEPLGLISPITVQLKIQMRKCHALCIGWDEEIDETMKREWVNVITRLKEAESVTFDRCVKPDGAIGSPVLIICTDGSMDAMCGTVYVRWECEDNSFKVNLWTAKTRVTPIKKLTIPRIELQAAVIGVRLRDTIQRNSIWKFNKVYHIVDSLCTLATLRKETSALKEFSGNRVAECLDISEIEDYYHVKSEHNIADLGTRCDATAADLGPDGDWQHPWWMSRPVSEWPTTQDIGKTEVPEEDIIRQRFCGLIQAFESPVDFQKYLGRSYQFVIDLLARLFCIADSKSFKDNHLTIECVKKAEKYVLKQCTVNTEKLLEAGKLKSLRPQRNADGIIILQSRAVEGLKKHYGTEEFPILTTDDPISRLWVKKIHEEDHGGITKVVAKSRRKYWIVRARKLAAKVIRSCYKCKIYDKLLAEQIMAPLPTSRVVMSPAFHEISLDLFGPFDIRDTVKGRCKKKVWGLILNCISARAVHLDVTEDYSTDSFLQAFRRFTALRRTPGVVYCDKGSQLKSAWAEFKEWGATRGMEVKPAPAEGQHQNGLSESLIKSVKKTLIHVIGNNVLTFSGLQTVFFEVANIVNSRPIGIISGSDPTCPEPITPNHLILGKETSDAPVGVFDTSRNVNKRFKFIQSLVDAWWKRWYERVLPSLVPSHKWLQRHRNVRVGDVCLIRYKNEIRSTYRLGRVTEVYPSSDGIVRKVLLQYKLPNEKVFRYVDRAIHGIAVIVPVEEQNLPDVSDVETSELNPEAFTFDPGNK